MTRLFPVLGDQLSLGLASLAQCDKAKDVVLMMEVRGEATTPRHHKMKIAFLFSAMRHFAAALREQGYRVDYVALQDEGNTHSFEGELRRALHRHKAERIIATWPGEWRVKQMLEGLGAEILVDTRFLAPLSVFAEWAQGRTQLRMEFFYRLLRRRLNILMEGDEPAGGRWNFDSENRHPLPPQKKIPLTYTQAPDAVTQEVLDLVAAEFPEHFGELKGFSYAVTRAGAQAALARFITQRLASFGDYQDAMRQNEPWLFHSHLSLYLNCGLLLPGECIAAAERAWRAGEVPLNAAEGFIRQILGWREYVRGLYWLKMPDYAAQNALGATRPLPSFYWDAGTEMNCLRQCVTTTRDHAYAHHIQRLMVLGNFALLAGLDPAEVNEWYLLVYADAYEWVEMPNVTGMILFADGGLLASKPYAAGGAYINRMSDYCGHCSFNVAQKTGPEACPFNYLYWAFLDRHRDKLGGNARLGLAYKTLNTMPSPALAAIRDSARSFLERL